MKWDEANQRYVRPAISAWRAGRVDEAESIFKEGLATTHNDGYVALNYAEFLEDLKRWRDAKALFETALRNLPLEKYKQRARPGLERIAQYVETTPKEVEPSHINERKGRIGLISCTKSKKRYPCTARELYSESDRSLDSFSEYEQKAWAKFVAANLRLETSGDTLDKPSSLYTY